jgi:hypothetical protein
MCELDTPEDESPPIDEPMNVVADTGAAGHMCSYSRFVTSALAIARSAG